MTRDLNFLRYPGGKRRMLSFLTEHLPSRSQFKGRFIEPFVGGGAIYFCLQPNLAVLSDLNEELIEIYLGIRNNAQRVWRIYRAFPSTKAAYRQIRTKDYKRFTLSQKAARLLYLNRTCFKGMWRHNSHGQFNVGYGGQSRRWAITRKGLVQAAELLRGAEISCCDFEKTIAAAKTDDFIFLDPPYRPGEKEQVHHHYGWRQFSFADQERLASCLKRADQRNVRWSMTNSSNSAIRNMYCSFKLITIPSGTGRRIGQRTENSGELLISNW